MSTKSEALRLAEVLETLHVAGPLNAMRLEAAATELRRLYALLEAEQALHQRVTYPELQRLRAQRDSLLEALKRLCSKQPRTSRQIDTDWDNARATIEAVEGANND